MKLTDLTLEALAEWDDGRFGTMFQSELNRAIADVADRPDDQTARKVTITLRVKPGAVDRHGLKSTHAEAYVKADVPKLRSRTHECVFGPDGGLQFNAESPEDAYQETIPFAGPDRQTATS